VTMTRITSRSSRSGDVNDDNDGTCGVIVAVRVNQRWTTTSCRMRTAAVAPACSTPLFVDVVCYAPAVPRRLASPSAAKRSSSSSTSSSSSVYTWS